MFYGKESLEVDRQRQFKFPTGEEILYVPFKSMWNNAHIYILQRSVEPDLELSSFLLLYNYRNETIHQQQERKTNSRSNSCQFSMPKAVLLFMLNIRSRCIILFSIEKMSGISSISRGK